MPSELPAAAAGSMTLGGDLVVRRMGFGAMRITGQGIWGDPPDRAKAHAVLRRAVELGVNLIDTADSYGPEVSEKIIAEALHPYPAGLVIATKGGLTRSGPGQWHRNGRPAHLRKVCEDSLRRLRVGRIDIYQLHAVDPSVPMEESLGELVKLRSEGKIRDIGLSNVSVDQLQRARKLVPIVSVQNRYNLADRASEDVLKVCEHDGLGFLPWYPVGAGDLARPGGPMDRAAKAHGVTQAQVALAWLLLHSPVTLPIPGTSSTAHLEENVAAAELTLDNAEMIALERG